MALYAVEDLDDALAATRAFLVPVDAGRWLRLAVLALFVAGGTGTGPPSGGGQVSTPTQGSAAFGPAADDVVRFLSENVAVVLALAALFLLLGLAVALVAAVFEFAFFDALAEEEVAIRRSVGRHWGDGLRLFGFRVALGLVGVVIVGGILLLGAAPLLAGLEALGAVALLFAIPVAIVLGVVLGVVNGFTTMFVVPVMLHTGEGVLAAWSRFWETLSGAWRQYLAYAVVGFVLNLLGGILVGIAAGLLALVLLIPVVVLVALGAALTGGFALPVWFVAIGVPGLIVFLAAVAVVQVPVQTYLRYFALFVLGDTDDDLDVIPERRAAVRGGPEEV